MKSPLWNLRQWRLPPWNLQVPPNKCLYSVLWRNVSRKRSRRRREQLLRYALRILKRSWIPNLNSTNSQSGLRIMKLSRVHHPLSKRVRRNNMSNKMPKKSKRSKSRRLLKIKNNQLRKQKLYKKKMRKLKSLNNHQRNQWILKRKNRNCFPRKHKKQHLSLRLKLSLLPQSVRNNRNEYSYLID